MKPRFQNCCIYKKNVLGHFSSSNLPDRPDIHREWYTQLLFPYTSVNTRGYQLLDFLTALYINTTLEQLIKHAGTVPPKCEREGAIPPLVDEALPFHSILRSTRTSHKASFVKKRFFYIPESRKFTPYTFPEKIGPSPEHVVYVLLIETHYYWSPKNCRGKIGATRLAIRGGGGRGLQRVAKLQRRE